MSNTTKTLSEYTTVCIALYRLAFQVNYDKLEIILPAGDFNSAHHVLKMQHEVKRTGERTYSRSGVDRPVLSTTKLYLSYN